MLPLTPETIVRSHHLAAEENLRCDAVDSVLRFVQRPLERQLVSMPPLDFATKLLLAEF